MVFYVWVDDHVAVSPMPSIGDIDELSRVFGAVLILVQPHEYGGLIDMVIERWMQRSTDVYYLPTPDFHPIQLLDLHRAAEWVLTHAEKGVNVLIHCKGGVGRSGLAATAYLLLKGMEFYDAVQLIREKRPGALLEECQFRMAEDYAEALSHIGRDTLNAVVRVGQRHGFGRGIKHASKSAQLSLELSLAFVPEHSKPVFIASALHGIGWPDKPLYRYAARAIVESQELGPTRLISARYLEEIAEDKDLSPEATLVLLGHILDETYDQRVHYLDIENYPGETRIVLRNWLDASRIVRDASELAPKIEEFTGKKTVFEERLYV